LVTSKNDDSRGLCSFFRSENEFSERIPVSKITFKDLIDKHQITNINFLKVDCEGMDYEIILQSFDNNIIPDLILFEDISLPTIGNVRGRNDLIKKLNEMDEVIMIDDTIEFQYEESNKLIIKKELLRYV
jgi:hypothetical protein